MTWKWHVKRQLSISCVTAQRNIHPKQKRKTGVNHESQWWKSDENFEKARGKCSSKEHNITLLNICKNFAIIKEQIPDPFHENSSLSFKQDKSPTNIMRIQVSQLESSYQHRETALQLFYSEFMYSRQESSYLAFFCHTHDTIKFTTPCTVQFAEGTANTTINENDIHCTLARWDGDASTLERWCEWGISQIIHDEYAVHTQ